MMSQQVSADFQRAELLKYTDPNHPVKQRLPFTQLPRLRKPAERQPSLMPSMPLTLFTPQTSAWTLIHCLFLSRITVSRHLKSPKLLCAQALLILWLSTLLQPWFPVRKLRVKWVIRMSVSTQDLCRRLSESSQAQSTNRIQSLFS